MGQEPLTAETPTSETAPESPAEEETVLPSPKPIQERVRFAPLHPEIPAQRRHDFRITDRTLGVGSKAEKYAANVAAIRTLQRVEQENRLATPEEQETLSRYVGWGGLADCFDEKHSRYAELKALLTEEEYAAARASSLTAFYTRPFSSTPSTRRWHRWAWKAATCWSLPAASATLWGCCRTA
ncbi:MAG: hypothetical protein ACLUS6_11895 [Dysosmobacter sp.]